MPRSTLSESAGAIKRTMSDSVTEATTSNSKRLKVTHSPEMSSRRDAKKRKRRRKKAPVVTKHDGVHHGQDSSSQHQRPPASIRNEIIRFTTPEQSGSSTSIDVSSHSTFPTSNSFSHKYDAEPDPIEGNSQAGTLETSKMPETIQIGSIEQPQVLLSSQTPSVTVLDDRVLQLTKELTQCGELVAAHQSVLSNISQALTCQICLDIMYKPYALAPCGHAACYDCLIQWFNAPSADGQPVLPAILRKKTCPHCRAVVRDRPAEIWTIKNLAHIIGKCGLLSVSPHNAEINADRPADTDPWDGIFRKSGHSFLPWLLAEDADPEPRRGEDVGMLDMEDGGIYRCLDCMHEIWHSVCTACGRRYPGHDGGEDWSDDELGLDFVSGVEEFDPDDDPGWMGLEGGDGDDEDDGLSIADWYPGLSLFRSRLEFGGNEEDEDESDDGDEGDLDDAAYDGSFIDDENDNGTPRGPMLELPHIYEISEDSGDDNTPPHVDIDMFSEEDAPSLSRRGRTAPIIVSSDEEDEDELTNIFAIRPMLMGSRRTRIVESDEENFDSSDDGSRSVDGDF